MPVFSEQKKRFQSNSVNRISLYPSRTEVSFKSLEPFFTNKTKLDEFI